MTRTVLISGIQKQTNERFYLTGGDHRVLHTGIQLEIWHDDEWIAGRVEHALPNGYFFDPASQNAEQRFDLRDGMQVRLTLNI